MVKRMILLVLSSLLFLGLSGLVAAIDAAVLSVTRPEVDELIQKGKWGSRRLRLVKSQITRSVVVIVILTNTINVLGPVLVSRQAFDLYGAGGIVTITVVLTLGTIVFSEIIPKSVGAHYAPLIARTFAPAIRLLSFSLYPLVVALAWLSTLFTRGTRQIGTEQQIRSLVRIGHEAGHIESVEGQMVHRAFVLNDKTAGEIMTPLDHVKAVGAGFSIKQAAAEVSRSEYSRYPVFDQSVDQVKGIVLSRDILKDAASSRAAASVLSITRPALLVKASSKSDELLVRFRDERVHLAVVQDLGKTVGVVTLEDVLEELVGEIEDEKDSRRRKTAP
jgi:CBS domain containing-hemolysin-like protein